LKGNFEYKEGDKVRCKKFLKGRYSHSNLYNGSEYIIENVYNTAGSGEPVFKPDGISIYVNANNFRSEDEFYEYFYSKKEIRKMKIDKINK